VKAEQHQLIDVLAQRGVSFVLVGGAAMQAHGIARPTKDVDVLIATSDLGVELKAALKTLRAEVVFVGSIGTAYKTALGKLDVLHRTDGVGAWEQWRPKAALRQLSPDGPEVLVAALDDIETDKQALGRGKDEEALQWIARFRIDPALGSPHPSERLLGPPPDDPAEAQRWQVSAAMIDRFREEHQVSGEAPLGDPADLSPGQLAGRDHVLSFLERMGVPTPGLQPAVEPGGLGELDLDV